jgi:membrane-associated protease RseP (regulator of RpoE activity)
MDDVSKYIYENILVLIGLPLGIIFVFMVHELAHYWGARIVGMSVKSVSVGVGKTIWTKLDRFGTQWVIRLYPIKAHVHIEDYHPEKGEKLSKRLFVVFAGPLANFLLPTVLFFLFFLLWGKPAVPTIVTGVEIGMPIHEAGLLPGDKILSVNDTPVKAMADIRVFTEEKTENPLRLEYERDKKTFFVDVMPEWHEYKDVDGKPRAHGRTGFMARQQPNSFEMLKSVNDIEIDEEDEDQHNDKARELVIQNLGKTTHLGLDSRDREVHVFIVDLNKELNSHLSDPDHPDYDYFFSGNLGDNFYIRLSVWSALYEAAEKGGELVFNIMRMPFNMFPIDREWIVPGPDVSHRSSYYGSQIYQLIFTLSLFSVLIGWINLIPFPGLDGSVILLNTAEAINKGPLSNKQKATLIIGAIFLLYLSVFVSNASNIHGYFEFKTEEFFEED